MDINDFVDSFFEEAHDLLEDMERQLLALDLDAPDEELINGIFRAAHSIKGGAGAFGFNILQQTTHLLENLLDDARKGELILTRDIVDTFLEAKDMLRDQLAAYRRSEEPPAEAYEPICRTLQQLAEEELSKRGASKPVKPGPLVDAEIFDDPGDVDASPSPQESEGAITEADSNCLCIVLKEVSEKDRSVLIDELAHFGEVIAQQGDEQRYEVTLNALAAADDIASVLCFVIDEDQLEITALPAQAGDEATEQLQRPEPIQPESIQARPAQPEPANVEDSKPTALAAVQKPANGAAPKAQTESSSIRVPVDKVDQIINLVGELIITQSMINQTVSGMEHRDSDALMNNIHLLQRNARDIQQAVMSIRMVPMDYVFSRFPRLVRDLAGKLEKDVELQLDGKSTELDKGLIERIVDPLTHLIRNSLDHGLEMPDEREAAGKSRSGTITLSAKHQGSNIVIEVADDGRGLNREKLMAKAREKGIRIADSAPDDEVWQLIFAPGFSTAESVSDISGRGVGMDVVRRNIQSMGGNVEIRSETARGTTTRIVLPLTLAILDGMAIRVGDQVFILHLSAVRELLQPSPENLYTVGNGDLLLKVRDEYLPVVSLAQAMRVGDPDTRSADCIAVIVQGEGYRYALLVDEPVGQQQVVVKSLETNYRKVRGVSAATILGDGSVALIIDLQDLYRFHQDTFHQNAQQRRGAGPELRYAQVQAAM